MSYSIFFDLETSDLNFIGQILNFSFIVVDSGWNIIDEFNSEIKINRLQLPRAKAILANRINVLEHQKRAKYTECQAMARIAEFLQDFVNKCQSSPGQLIGYNSANFDLTYLRTSLIRNGYNPYSKIQNRDLLLLAQKLSVTNSLFQDRLKAYADKTGEPINLKLETLCKAHGLLDGKQLHESREDVLLTIELAKTFLNLYGADIRSFEPYEGRALHRQPRGAVFPVIVAASKLEPIINNFTLLQSDHRSALWIDLDKYQECVQGNLDKKIAIRWLKFDGKIFIPTGEANTDPNLVELAKQALSDFKDVNLDNFFEQTTCDIEQFIYRIPFKSFPLLYQFMHDPKGSGTLDAEEKELVKRYRLANYELGSGDDLRMNQALKDYAEYRYGGQAQIAKNLPEDLTELDRGKAFHPTLDQLFMEIEESTNEEPESISLMKDLKEFYSQSEIYQLLKK